MASIHSRWAQQRGHRPVRIANCSGYKADPGYKMLEQASLGDVDFITGDYLAEVNIAENAEAMAAGTHPGYEFTAWDGIQQSIDVLNEKGIKVIVNGGAQNPKGLAERVCGLVRDKSYGLKVAWIEGDNLLKEAREMVKNGQLPPHLDSENAEVHLAKGVTRSPDSQKKPIVSANAYLGAREIVKALELGADIVIAGRVADASPVIGAAWYWHSWSETDYDRLAGALVAGHLIECSGYVTGSNFAGFYEWPLDSLYDIPFGIAEVAADGSCVVTKHENTKGMVTSDTVKTQFLYELQGNVYLNSDVKAYLDGVEIVDVGKDRVRLSGIRGAPPPPTTKLAIFYRGGFQSEIVVNATGYATTQKWQLYEKIVRNGLKRGNMLDKFDILEFQACGVPKENPRTQLESTTYLRIFTEAATREPGVALLRVIGEYAMQHFSGFHNSMDMRTGIPRSFLSFYPALYPQDSLKCAVNALTSNGEVEYREETRHPVKYEKLEPRDNYDTKDPVELSSFGPTRRARLGDITLARSGDKGGNCNFGIYVRDPEAWPWLRSFLSREKMQELIQGDWRDGYFLERVEFPKIMAVHFVVYGILGRGVSGSSRLDALGKGFADYVRDKVVEMPAKFLERAKYVNGLEGSHMRSEGTSHVNGEKL